MIKIVTVNRPCGHVVSGEVRQTIKLFDPLVPELGNSVSNSLGEINVVFLSGARPSSSLRTSNTLKKFTLFLSSSNGASSCSIFNMSTWPFHPSWTYRSLGPFGKTFLLRASFARYTALLTKVARWFSMNSWPHVI